MNDFCWCFISAVFHSYYDGMQMILIRIMSIHLYAALFHFKFTQLKFLQNRKRRNGVENFSVYSVHSIDLVSKNHFRRYLSIDQENWLNSNNKQGTYILTKIATENVISGAVMVIWKCFISFILKIFSDFRKGAAVG